MSHCSLKICTDPLHTCCYLLQEMAFSCSLYMYLFGSKKGLKGPQMRFFGGSGESSHLRWELSPLSFWHFNYQKLMTHKSESCTGTGVLNVSAMIRCYQRVTFAPAESRTSLIGERRKLFVFADSLEQLGSFIQSREL